MAKSKSNDFVLQKVKNHSELKHLPEDQQTVRAAQLTSHDDVLCQFSYLLDTGSRLIMDKTRNGYDDDDDDRDLLQTMEERAAHQQAKQDMARACHLPVKLILSQLRRGRPPFAHTWSSLFGFEYGPLHTALQVGEVLIEWSRESLVIPKYEPILPGRDMQVNVHGEGEWRETVGQFVLEMSMADHAPRRRTEKKVDALCRSVAEKAQLIANLVEVIVTYNRDYKYDLFNRNCQHFVRDAMAALGIKEAPQLSGKLSEYYKRLKDGKTKMPEFQEHESVDRYVTDNFDQLSQHDMEFLLCQYFRHHYSEMSQAVDIEEWKCPLPTCQSQRLEDRIKHNSLLFNQFHPDEPRPLPQATRRRKVTDKRGHKVAEMSIQQQPKRPQPEMMVGQASSKPTLVEDTRDHDKEYLDEKLPQEFMQGVSLERQASMLGKCNGYHECIEFKLRRHPDYKDENQALIDSRVDILGEPKHFQETYFDKDSQTTQELAARIIDDFKMIPLIPSKDAKERTHKNFTALNTFPLKLLFYPLSQQSSLDVFNAPLDVRLQLGQYILDWSSTGLLIPKKAPTRHFQPMLSVCPMELSTSQQRAKVNEAIQTINLDLLTQLVFSFVAEQDKLLKAVIQVAVEYNRHKEYHEITSTSAHFVTDICKAVGIPAGTIITSLRQFRPYISTSQYALRHFFSHLALDNFVIDLNWHNKTASLPQIDLQYLVAQYFYVHMLNWVEKRRPEYWTCDEQNCQLSELEKLLH